MVPLEALTDAATTSTAGPSWTVFVIAVLGSSVVAGLLSAALDNLGTAGGVRRDAYAQVSRVLLRRVEFAYRVRRRVSDEPATLAALTGLGSDIQEELAARKAWVASENHFVAAVLDEVCAAIDTEVRTATEEAWRSPPVTSPADMNLGEWGPRGHSAHLDRLQRAVATRFGWRRLVPTKVWEWNDARARGRA